MSDYIRDVTRVVCIILGIALTGCATNTITGRKQLMLVSEQQAIAQSANAYSSLVSGLSKSGKINTDAKVDARIQGITNRLISQAVKLRPDTQNWQWSVQVIDDPNTINAFCMAGGKMAIYTGLINKLNPSDDEIAEVMGHEISHALANHQAEKMSVEMASGLAVVALTTTANQQNRQAAYDLSSLTALTLVRLPNSRTEESEADRIGIELAAKAGYNPHAAVTLWQKMIKATGQTSRFDFLSTHPASPKRMEALAQLESRMMPLYEASRNNVGEAKQWVVIVPPPSNAVRDAFGPTRNIQKVSSAFVASGESDSAGKSKRTDKAYSVTQKLRELYKLRQDDVITEKDFQNKKRELLKEF